MNQTSIRKIAKPGVRGFTLIELMVAMLLGILIVGGIVSLIVSGRRNYNQDELVSRMQDELRFAMAQLTLDVEMGGFWGALLDPGSVILDGSLTVANDCGVGSGAVGAVGTWTYGNRSPLDFLNGPTASSASAAFPCIDASDFLDSTDVLAIKRIASAVTRTVPTGAVDSRVGMTNGLVYLKTNNSTAALFTQNGTANPTVSGSAFAAPYEYWQYTPTVYYIRKYSTIAGDNIPSLCREVLTRDGAVPKFESECLARGIENMQVEIGVDDDDDGVADRYMEDPGTLSGNASSVRITLLARAERPDNTYSNQKSYRLTAATTTTPGDRFYRRSLSTVVAIRNPSALRRIK